MSIDERLTKLENLVESIVSTLANNGKYDKADKNVLRNVDYKHGEGINENDTAICDVADLSDVNSQAIDDLAEIVDELSNKIAEMEG